MDYSKSRADYIGIWSGQNGFWPLNKDENEDRTEQNIVLYFVDIFSIYHNCVWQSIHTICINQNLQQFETIS